MNLLRRTVLALITLVPLMLSAGDDSSRLHSLATKVFCSCGCREILSECSHPECTAKVPLKQEITFAVQSGKTDSEILANLEKKYGADILLVPSFRGFNVLLWIVPLAVGVTALAIFVWRRRVQAQ